MDSSRPAVHQPDGVAVVILAAGAGTRMKSDLPKPLHPVAGLPMIEHVIGASRPLDPSQIVVVASPELVAAWQPSETAPPISIVLQDPPLGTGHAVLTACQYIEGANWIVVLYADHPLVTGDVLLRLVQEARSSRSLVTLLTCELGDARSYGRIDRDDQGHIHAIVEEGDDDPAARQGPVEINSGMMVIDGQWGVDALRRIPKNERKQEFFLTDIVALANAESQGERGRVTSVLGDLDLLLGVNNRVELAAADGLLRNRIRTDLMEAGVTLVGPETIFIDADVTIGRDSTILPHTQIGAGTRIGERCTIGPGSVVERASIGNDVRVTASFVRDSAINGPSDVGPFSHIRNGSVIDNQVHIGNFAEVKATHIHPGVRVGHFSYLGDASIGHDTNIGAGTVTCNYDGVAKHRTEIGADAFIGSDTMLVAPISVGDGAVTGAGSVVTKDVAPGAKVVGVPARAVRARPGGSTQEGEDGER